MNTISFIMLAVLLTGPTTFEQTASGLQFREIKEMPGKDKDFLFHSAKKWINTTFRHPERATTLSDSSTGQIILKTKWADIEFPSVPTSVRQFPL